MGQEFMKEKPVVPLVISMAFPMTISMLVNSLYNIVDSFFVAKISGDAMTALSLIFPVQNLVNAITVGFAIGINAVISFYLGAGRKVSADTAATAGLLLNILHGFLLSILCIGGMELFLLKFTENIGLVNMGMDYSRIAFLFCVPIGAGVGFEKIFQAVGQMKVSMLSMLAGCIVNIVLDPLMIFGIGIFPKMGIEGAALATGIGQVTSLVIYICIYWKRRKTMAVRISFTKLENVKDIIGKMYGIGIPAVLNMALPSLMISVLNGMLAAYSSAYVLVLGVYYKLQTFLYLTANGIVQGMRPICGYNYGAGELKRVKDILKTGLVLISAVMAGGTVLSICIPSQLMGLFTTDSETVALGRSALLIISRGFVISGISVAVSGVLEGMGKGRESLFIALARYMVVILPLSFFFSHVAGAAGVWQAFWVTEGIAAVLSAALFQRSIRHTSVKV